MKNLTTSKNGITLITIGIILLSINTGYQLRRSVEVVRRINDRKSNK